MRKILLNIGLAVFLISAGLYFQLAFIGAPYGIISNPLFRLHLPYGLYPKYWQFPMEPADFELTSDNADNHVSFPISERYLYEDRNNYLFFESSSLFSNKTGDIKLYQITLDTSGRISCIEIPEIPKTEFPLSFVQLSGNDYFVSQIDAAKSLISIPLIWAFALLSIIIIWSLFIKVKNKR